MYEVYEVLIGACVASGRGSYTPGGGVYEGVRRVYEGVRSPTRAPTGARAQKAHQEGAYQGRLPGAPTRGAYRSTTTRGGVVGFSTGGGRKLNRMNLMGHFFRIKAG